MTNTTVESSMRYWSREMHKAASAVESQGDGSVACMQVIAGNRAVADTLAKGADEIESLRRQLAEAEKGALGVLRSIEEVIAGAHAALDKAGAPGDSSIAIVDRIEAMGGAS